MPKKKHNDGYYTTQEFADMFGVSTEVVRQWIHRGQLKATKTDDGQRTLIPKDAVISYKRPWMAQKRELKKRAKMRANPVQI